MKRIFSIFAAALLAVGCSDSEALEGDVSGSTSEPISFVLGDLGAISTKVDANAVELKSSWTEGDEVAIVMAMDDNTALNAYKYKIGKDGDGNTILVAAEAAEFYAAGSVASYYLCYPYIDNNSSSYASLNDEFSFITKEYITSISASDNGQVVFNSYSRPCCGYIFDLDLTLNSGETFSSWNLTFTCGDGIQYSVKDVYSDLSMTDTSVTLLTTQELGDQNITQVDITITTTGGKTYSYVDSDENITGGLVAELKKPEYNAFGSLVKHTITIDHTDIIK